MNTVQLVITQPCGEDSAAWQFIIAEVKSRRGCRLNRYFSDHVDAVALRAITHKQKTNGRVFSYVFLAVLLHDVVHSDIVSGSLSIEPYSEYALEKHCALTAIRTKRKTFYAYNRWVTNGFESLSRAAASAQPCLIRPVILSTHQLLKANEWCFFVLKTTYLISGIKD